MRAYGSDRVRTSGGRVILHSRLPKGWTARVEKTLTSAEFPGTAVYWDEQYYEVLSAEPLPAGGVRYVLGEWQDHHAIRQFRPYDAQSEELLAADDQRAARQRRHSVLARVAAMLLGHLPAHVQQHLANELGLFPHRLTLWSIVPVIVAAGTCVYVGVDRTMESLPSPIPDWFMMLFSFMLAESVFRFFVAMSQQRPMGSMAGMLVYLVYWLLHPNRARLVRPFASARGEGVMMIPPSAEVAERDALEMRAPLLTLLTPAEQELLAKRFDFDYRKHAYGITWAILVFAALGAASMIPRAAQSLSALVSLVCATLVGLEQVLRLLAFKRGPAGSVFGVLVRPFARDLLGNR